MGEEKRKGKREEKREESMCVQKAEAAEVSATYASYILLNTTVAENPWKESGDSDLTEWEWDSEWGAESHDGVLSSDEGERDDEGVWETKVECLLTSNSTSSLRLALHGLLSHQFSDDEVRVYVCMCVCVTFSFYLVQYSILGDHTHILLLTQAPSLFLLSFSSRFPSLFSSPISFSSLILHSIEIVY